MAAANKKKQKMKGKTLNLNEFLGDTGPGSSYVLSNKPVSWAEEVENADDPDEDYGTGTSSSNINRAVLPTAPRSARGPDIDLSKVPTEPPFTAFLGNLPFDASEEEIEKFFHGLVVKNIRIPPGRSKGFGYAEFEDRQALIEALGRNDRTLRNRQIRIDLADQHGGDRDQRNDRERDWGRGRREDDGGEDKTQGDWRRGPARPADDRGSDRDRYGDRDRSFGGDRYNRSGDRGGDRFGDRGGDRYGDRGGDRGGDRYGDRGGDRYGDRGGDRYGDRGGDRYGDRGGDRYGDRGGDDRGFGRRAFGTGFGRDGERRDGDRYGDRRDSDRYGHRHRDDRAFERGPPPPRDDRFAERRDTPKERPRLNLQPRSKPKEEAPAEQNGSPAPPSAASIFGGAKPVDTAAREREIEERILREKKAEEDRWEQERENRLRETRDRERTSSGGGGGSKMTRQDSDSSQGRQRKLSSSSSGKGIRPVAPPPGAGSARVRRDSTISDDENVFDDDKPLSPKSPKSPTSKKEDSAKLVPAPPPKENVWAKRQQSHPEKEDHDKENRRNSNKSPTSPINKAADSKSSNVRKADFVPAQPPKENPWTKRKEQTPDGGYKGKHWDDKKPDHARSPPSKDDSKPKRKEKPLPTSIDEMPKYEEKKAVDLSDTNKFQFLPDEDEAASDE